MSNSEFFLRTRRTVFQARRQNDAVVNSDIERPEIFLLAPFARHPVKGDGNCFFHAVAHRLQIAGLRDTHGEPYDSDILRALVLSHVDQYPALR